MHTGGHGWPYRAARRSSACIVPAGFPPVSSRHLGFRFTRTCYGMLAGSSSPMTGTILERYNIILGIAIFSTQSGTRSSRLSGLTISGTTSARTLKHRRVIQTSPSAGFSFSVS